MAHFVLDSAYRLGRCFESLVAFFEFLIKKNLRMHTPERRSILRLGAHAC